jgi:2-polyprenyl-3-methyl-5-hydroxy-6-metoxy-1,4-benzoquinol methylase
LCSTEHDNSYNLGSFDSPSQYNSTKFRADLHPTWNISGSKYIVDIIENDERKVVIGDVFAKQHNLEKEAYLNFYEKNRSINYGHDYNNYVTENDSHYNELMYFIDKYSLKDSKVLEIGSSGGFFQDIVEDYSGTDVSKLLAKHFHKRYRVATGTTFPFDDQEFDAIFTFDTFEHIPHLQEAMLDTVRMLKPGGMILFQPAWQCRSWAAEGYPVRPYGDFNFIGKLIKLSIPIRNSFIYRSIKLFPKRLYRHLAYFFGKKFDVIRYKKLKPNYKVFWMSDSDACNHIDMHDAILWFRSYGFKCLTYPTHIKQLFAKNGGIVFQKNK